jgi:nitrogen-specific signal transduction histidine kinase/CheY-like chemotaxis protein
MIGSHSDVTQRKLAEEKVYQTELQLRNSQKLNALGTLAGGIAHDFNNILSAILGYTELSLSQALHDETLRKYLAEVTQAGMRAKDLVRQILTFSRHRETQKKPLILQKVVEEVLLLIRATLPTTITIQQRLSGESDLIQGDATQIHQVLMNLCTNAEYAMREQGGILTVQLETFEGSQEYKLAHFHDLPAGTYLLLTVKDTGHGIAADILDKIFDPFFTTKKTGQGTGMGLAVVHGIIADHQGHIRVQSMQGKGTIVSIVFPLIGVAPANMEIDREPERPSSAPCKPKSQGHVLFVDDEAPLVALGKELLENFGYQVTPFTNSVDALKAFRATPDCFDILITDQTMPNLTGEALAREVLKIRPDFPILLCTGFSYTMTAEKAQKVGIRKFMMKPLLPSELVLAIQEVLRVVCSKD